MSNSCNVKPFAVPGNGAVVSPWKPGAQLSFGGAEKALFDSTTVEQAMISGTSVDYWTIDPTSSPRDPLYGEPKERVFLGPFKLYGIFSAPQKDLTVSEEGLSSRFTSTLAIPRKLFELARCPIPRAGDVIQVWKLPIYVAVATPEANPLAGAGYFFDVMNPSPDGYVGDNPTFTRWNMALKRRSEFTPERRLKRP